MTVAPQLSVGNTLQALDDTSYSIFQNVNAPNNIELVCGNIFLGIQGSFAVVIPLGEQLGLCRGGQIETGLIAATVTMVATRNWTVGGQIQVNCMLDDSPRAGPLDARLAWKPPAGFGPAWRRDVWGTFKTRLEDTGGSPFIDTPASNNATWGIRAVTGHREQLAQLFTVPAGPSWSVARAIMQMTRHGSPIGSMEVAIQGDTTDGYGHAQPDGIDLGVSAAVLNSTIALTPGSTFVTYAFTPDVVLAPGNYWAVVRPSVSYPVSLIDFIVWHQNRAFFNIGGSHRTLNGIRFDLGNYPGHADVSQDLVKTSGPSVLWDVPATSVGQTRSTPDLSSLVQEVILTSGHETASALCFTFVTVGETRTFGFRAHGHPSGSPPGFAAQFRRRDTRGEVT